MRQQFILPVIRTNDPAVAMSLGECLSDAGARVFEITLMSDSMLEVIGTFAKRGLNVGAGTVIRLEQAKAAQTAGASFLISPGVSQDVLSHAQELSIPYVPGVLTPTEITSCIAEGFSTFKLFPVSAMGGAGYVRSVSAPFPTAKWILSGGIKLADVAAHKAANVLAVSLGEELFPKDLVREQKWSEITGRVRKALA